MMVPRVPRCTQQYASLLQVIIKQIILVLLSTSACGDPVFLLLVRAFIFQFGSRSGSVTRATVLFSDIVFFFFFFSLTSLKNKTKTLERNILVSATVFNRDDFQFQLCKKLRMVVFPALRLT